MKAYSINIRNSQNSRCTGGIILTENGKVTLINRDMPYSLLSLPSWNEYNPIGCSEEQMIADIKAMNGNEISVSVTLIGKQ